MECPQCGAQTPDDEWNCASCRMNVYWASQHYGDLAFIRRDQGLRESAETETPTFLRLVHAAVIDERATRGGKVEHRVRQIARRVMKEAAARTPAGPSAELPREPS
jgi:hypothetical protein